MNKFEAKLAKRGSFCLSLSLVMTTTGIILKDAIFTTLGVSGITLMICCYILGRLNLSNITPKLSLPNRIHANKRYQPAVTLTNARNLIDCLHAKLYIALPHEVLLDCEARWIPANSSATRNVPILIPHRSAALDLACKIVSSFPLGLFLFSKRKYIHHPLTVYPRPITPVELLDHGSLDQSTTPTITMQSDYSGEPKGIRSWIPGDPAKSIHWPASARSLAREGQLSIREFEPPGFFPETCAIVFHSYSHEREMMREDSFERAISLLAGTIHHLRNLNIEITVHADCLGWMPQKAKTRAEYYELLAMLAEVERAKGTEQHEIDTILTKINHDPSILISDMPIDAWAPYLTLPHTSLPIDIEQIHFSNRKVRSAKDALTKTA